MLAFLMLGAIPVLAAETPAVRMHLDVGVQLPAPFWLFARHNQQARIHAFSLALVTACVPNASESRSRRKVSCHLEDVSLQAAGMGTDAARVPGLARAWADTLRGANAVLLFGRDGRLVRIDDLQVADGRRRGRHLADNMRLLLERAFAGLESPRTTEARPEGAFQPGQLTSFPSPAPDVVGGQVVHRQTVVGDEREVVSGGELVVSPLQAAGDLYAMDIRSSGVWSDQQNAWVARVWEVAASPHASASSARGFAGGAYIQRGHARALDDGVGVELPPSGALVAPPRAPTTLERTWVLGRTPR